MAAMARPARSEREPYDREQIVAAAVRVFKERGYDGTSMLDIARALGIHKSSLYHHIDGKEQLLETAVRHALGLLSGVLDEPAANEGRAVDRLEHVLRRTGEIIVAQLDEVTVLLRVRGNTATERWAIRRRREVDSRVQAILVEAIAEGDLRSDIDPALATRLLFGMANSVTEWLQPGGRLGSRAVGDAVVHICLDGLRS